jgi:hypothetical protein
LIYRLPLSIHHDTDLIHRPVSSGSFVQTFARGLGSHCFSGPSHLVYVGCGGPKSFWINELRLLLTKVLSVLLVILVAGCDAADIPIKRADLREMSRGDVTWHDSEESSTWSGADRPYFLFIASRRSYWSWEMVRESFTVPEIVSEINHVTRAVWIDADLRPDLVDRYGLGGLPSLAVLTPDLKWITGTTFMGRDDMVGLLRRIRILNDIPDRLADLERERKRLLQRMPVSRAPFSQGESLPEVVDELAHQISQTDPLLRSGEAQLFLLEVGAGETGLASWIATALRTARYNSAGVLTTAVLTDGGHIRDESVSLRVNAGVLHTLVEAIDRDAVDHRKVHQLISSVVEELYDPEMGLFLSGQADFSLSDSSLTALPVIEFPRLYDARSLTAENATMVSVLLRAGDSADAAHWRDLAKQILDRLIETRAQSGRVYRSEQMGIRQLEDVANLVRACLDGAEALRDDAYSAQARALVDQTMSEILRHPPPGDAPHRELQRVAIDDEWGAAVGVLAQCIVRLHEIDHQGRYLGDAEMLCREAIDQNAEWLGRLGAVGRALARINRVRVK